MEPSMLTISETNTAVEKSVLPLEIASNSGIEEPSTETTTKFDNSAPPTKVSSHFETSELLNETTGEFETFALPFEPNCKFDNFAPPNETTSRFHNPEPPAMRAETISNIDTFAPSTVTISELSIPFTETNNSNGEMILLSPFEVSTIPESSTLLSETIDPTGLLRKLTNTTATLVRTPELAEEVDTSLSLSIQPGMVGSLVKLFEAINRAELSSLSGNLTTKIGISASTSKSSGKFKVPMPLLKINNSAETLASLSKASSKVESLLSNEIVKSLVPTPETANTIKVSVSFETFSNTQNFVKTVKATNTQTSAPWCMDLCEKPNNIITLTSSQLTNRTIFPFPIATTSLTDSASLSKSKSAAVPQLSPSIKATSTAAISESNNSTLSVSFSKTVDMDEKACVSPSETSIVNRSSSRARKIRTVATKTSEPAVKAPRVLVEASDPQPRPADLQQPNLKRMHEIYNFKSTSSIISTLSRSSPVEFERHSETEIPTRSLTPTYNSTRSSNLSTASDDSPELSFPILFRKIFDLPDTRPKSLLSYQVEETQCSYSLNNEKEIMTADKKSSESDLVPTTLQPDVEQSFYVYPTGDFIAFADSVITFETKTFNRVAEIIVSLYFSKEVSTGNGGSDFSKLCLFLWLCYLYNNFVFFLFLVL